MKILLTGANGYIGKRLLPALINLGHHVICGVRDPKRFTVPQQFKKHIDVIKLDLQNIDTLSSIPPDIDGAYYLVHSMSNNDNYFDIESSCANNFVKAISKTKINHVIYLSGIINDDVLSEHLASRKNVETILSKGSYHLTTFRAGIIIGSGSASFEIIRDLVEKLPIMITPKWLNTKSQPIAIFDVIQFLSKGLFNSKVYDNNFDIGGPDVISYKEMLLQFGEERSLKRYIITVPIMTPKLSSYWLYFVTSTSYKLAKALVSSMNIEIKCRDSEITKILSIKPLNYREAIQRAFKKIENDDIISSWKDSFISSETTINTNELSLVPTYGCFKDLKTKKFNDRTKCINKIWKLGGDVGWYYANWLWQARGLFDKFSGGVGLRRGRTNLNTIQTGDALDFWRVLYADKKEGRLLLYAEMKLPGEAWLEFRIENNNLIQQATFRPLGIMGRLYWYLVTPFHGFIFNGLINKLTTED